MNLFQQSIDDSIIYFFDVDEGDSYQNFSEITTRGVEVAGRYVDDAINLIGSYSYYELGGGDSQPYSVFDENLGVLDGSQLTGAAPHKFTLGASYAFSDQWNANTNLVVFGEKYAYTSVNEEESLVAERLDVVWLLDTNIQYRPAQNITLTLGGHNLLDEDVFFVQPYYDGFHAPLPGAGRTFFGRVSYAFEP